MGTDISDPDTSQRPSKDSLPAESAEENADICAVTDKQKNLVDDIKLLSKEEQKDLQTLESNGKSSAEAFAPNSEMPQKRKAEESKDLMLNPLEPEGKMMHLSDASKIASHYNAIQPVDPTKRHQSQILHLRNLNNWVKQVLILEFGGRRHGVRDVLDLACGKGGDLFKWRKASIRTWTGVDIADVSIQEAQRRYQDAGQGMFEANFHVLDAFHDDWAMAFGTHSYDAISCQFAYHYSFETEKSARHSIKMIAKYLRPGGVFFGSIPNFKEILSRFSKGQADGQDCKKTRSIGNDIYTLSLCPGTRLDGNAAFGQRYHFNLAEAVEECPEYFIPFQQLSSLAQSVGLKLVMCEPFQAFYERFGSIPEYAEILERMRVVVRGRMSASAEELEVASLYLAFCFRKSA